MNHLLGIYWNTSAFPSPRRVQINGVYRGITRTAVLQVWRQTSVGTRTLVVRPSPVGPPRLYGHVHPRVRLGQEHSRALANCGMGGALSVVLEALGDAGAVGASREGATTAARRAYQSCGSGMAHREVMPIRNKVRRIAPKRCKNDDVRVGKRTRWSCWCST
jgi:hypothetical protein